MKKIRNSINSKVKTYNYALKTLVISLLSLVLFWAFRFASGFPLYLCSLSLRLAPKVKIRLRHFDKLSDLVPVPETRSRNARKGCRSNP